MISEFVCFFFFVFFCCFFFQKFSIVSVGVYAFFYHLAHFAALFPSCVSWLEVMNNHAF